MLLTAWLRRSHYELVEVDVYSGRAFMVAEAVCALLRAIRKPYILTLHGGNLPNFSAGHPQRVRNLLRNAVAVTAPSGFLVDKMRPYREDIRLIPNAIQLERYDFRLRTEAKPKLIWLRTFHRLYDPVTAVRAAALAAREFPDLTLALIGADRHDGSLADARREAMVSGLQKRVVFPGPAAKQNVGLWIDSGDIFLNTSTIDNTPVSVMEAMACGCCVVSTNVGGVPYLVNDETEGLLVPPGDAGAMAAQIVRILKNPALAERLSRHARQRVESLSWHNVLPQWERILALRPAGQELPATAGIT
jgi:glycosyltransferase involved in cell wall biosynthesis